MGSLDQGIFLFFYFYFLGVNFVGEKWKKTVFSLWVFSPSLSISLFLCTHSLGSFEFNQFHKSNL